MLVSVLIPVYNGENHISIALKSILSQSYRNLQIVVIDDGSTDRTAQEIDRCKDSRVQIIRNGKNIGIVESLNLGLSFCNGELVARMDADDISIDNRIEKQVGFMMAHPRCVCVGSRYRILNGSAVVNLPLEDSDIRIQLWESSPICHPSALIRGSVFENIRYEKAFQYAEDYKLWSDLSDIGELQNLSEPLLTYRRHPNQIAKMHAHAQRIASDQVRLIQLRKLIKDVGDKKGEFHLAFINGSSDLNTERLIDWTTTLIYENSIKRVLKEPAFTKFLLGKVSQCVGSDGRKSLRDLIVDRIRRRLKASGGWGTMANRGPR